ncbi:epimerase [Neisseria sp.]|uniref:epimerase n=1 Tax=Neisseria sp. TaxID=192066 RepID=UPI0035A197DB
MNIILFGGSGFIGRRVTDILRTRDHLVKTPSRRDFDYLQPDEAAARALLHGQDCVVNCIGVMSRRTDVLETVHHHTPALLARLAAEAGIRNWVQLSALGAHPAHPVAFVGSKGRGDEVVCGSGLHVNTARPSVVYGRGGTSCELFIKLARLPVLALPAGGRFDLQPVHVNEVAEGLAVMAETPLPHGTAVDMAGGRRVTLAQYLSLLRETLHRKPPLRVVPVPLSLIRPVLPLANLLSDGIVSLSSFKLLEEGSCADTAGFAALLGREPLAAERFADTA